MTYYRDVSRAIGAYYVDANDALATLEKRVGR